VFVVAASIAYAALEPGLGGDSARYLLVARNILFNGCVSISDPQSALCAAHWGGNQFPGYPAFMAFTGLLAGLKSTANTDAFIIPVIVLQSVLSGGAAVRLGWAVKRFSNSSSIGLICVLLAGLSPLHFAWSRWLLTESLSISVAIWVLAELILSLHERRLRVVPLAVALAIGFFLRYDAITLCAAVVPVAFVIHPPWQAIWRGMMIALLMTIPIVAWSARNVAQGLSIYPVPNYGLGHGRGQGYYGWLTIWVTDLYMGANAAFPAANRRYSQITLPPQAYLDDQNREVVNELLRRWAQHDGEEAPDWVDAKFHDLAVERRRRDPLGSWLLFPVRRALYIWLAPAYSYGWNVELGDRARQLYGQGNWSGLLDFAFESPGKIVIKMGVALLHLVVLGGFGLILFWRRSNQINAPNLRPIVWAVLAYALTRTVFLALMGQADPRLSVEVYPFFEIALVLVLLRQYDSRQVTSLGTGVGRR
jgi:hypothetical protein